MKRILLLLFISVQLYSQGICNDNIVFNYDYSVFRGENGKSILEIYYSVSQQSLLYVKTENKYEAAALVQITITDLPGNNIIFSNIYKSPSIVDDTSKGNISQKLIGQVNYILDNGNYRLSILGSDFNDSTRKDLFEQDLKIEASKAGDLSISEIELSTSIKKSDNQESPFYKNTLEVIPNPSGLYGMNLNELHYYYEIYALTDNNISEDYYVNYSVYDLNNVNLISSDKKFKRKTESKADFGKFIIDSLDRGSYLFRVTVTDTLKKVKLSTEKKFYIFKNSNSTVITTRDDEFLRSEFSKKSDQEIQEDFKKMTYILSDQEKKRFKNLENINDKRKFMYDFWKAKDYNPNTQVLETKIAYFKRVNETNKMFREAYTEGWKTDRGRIFIIYGKPDDIEKYPFESQSKSYEIWKYNSVEGGGECAFVEIQQATGVFKLVHSTFRNELKNQDWKNEIDKY
ncbi:MAG TPA: GWxTD domain-containing protein [Ignavibacteria bacterium]|nr:GWxTD domain-containing protein [Ignavibacteria bacterium]